MFVGCLFLGIGTMIGMSVGFIVEQLYSKNKKKQVLL